MNEIREISAPGFKEDRFIILDNDGFDVYGEHFNIKDAKRLLKELTMKTFEIRDWANNLMFDGKEFNSYEEGWEFIYENIEEEYEGDGTYDDIYVIPKQK